MRKQIARLSDAELVLLARDGDAAAFEELYDRHAPGVTGALASFAGADAGALDDLVQEVFMKVVEGLSSYAPQRPFPHWLYTIALNTGRNHVRGRTRETSVDPSELEAMPLGRNGAEDSLENILCARLIRLVAGLPEHMREVVSLRIGSDVSYSEIGDILGIPEGTARSRMHNAIANLKERLGVEGTESEKERS